MRFHAIISGWYECADTHLMETYGTTDPEECCRIDEKGDIHELVSYMEDLSMTVTTEPIPKVSKP